MSKPLLLTRALLQAARALGAQPWRPMAVLIGALAVMPLVVGTDAAAVDLANFAFIYAILALGLQLLNGTTRMISLCQAGFAAIGAYTAGILSTKLHVSPWLAFLPAAVIPALVAFGVGWFVGRLQGFYLAMATLSLAGIISLWSQQLNITGGSFGISNIPAPAIGAFALDGPAAYYYFLLVVTAATFLFSLNILNSRVGRALHAIGQSDLAARACGVDVRLYKAQIFAFGAVLAGLAGALYAEYLRFIGPDFFGVRTNVVLLMMVIIGGSRSVYGALLGAAILTVLPNILASSNAQSLVVYGLIVVVMFIFLPNGISGIAHQLWQRAGKTLEARVGRQGGEVAPLERQARPQHVTALSAAAPTPSAAIGRLPRAEVDGKEGPDLSCQHLFKRYGGLSVLKDLSITVPAGGVTALIGPNGAGKTTLFRIIARTETPDAGTVRFGKSNLLDMQTHEICEIGIGRVFQHPHLCPKMTVLDNVMLGLHSRTSAGYLESGLCTRMARREEAAVKENALTVLDLLGIVAAAEQRASDLPFGVQRLVEVGRAIATRPQLLLLDEPTAGLNPTEQDLFKNMLASLRRLGMGILLIEHNVRLVVEVASRVLVLSDGDIIFDGPPADAVEHPAVVEAYIGREVAWGKSAQSH